MEQSPKVQAELRLQLQAKIMPHEGHSFLVIRGLALGNDAELLQETYDSDKLLLTVRGPRSLLQTVKTVLEQRSWNSVEFEDNRRIPGLGGVMQTIAQAGFGTFDHWAAFFASKIDHIELIDL